MLLGFDKNEFGAFEKSINLTTLNKELFYHDKIIYIDHNLVSFSGFLDLFKSKDLQASNNNANGTVRKSSFSSTPLKIRKRSLSEEVSTSRLSNNSNSSNIKVITSPTAKDCLNGNKEDLSQQKGENNKTTLQQ